MKVLIVVDMQNDFVTGPLGSPAAQAVVPNIVEKIENCDKHTLLIMTQDTHGWRYLETQEGRNLPIKHCLNRTEGWCVVPDIVAAAHNSKVTLIEESESGLITDSCICKGTFGSTALAGYLSEYADKIDEIELVGVCTDICVVSNALVLKAFMPEIPITVDASCCAGVTSEKHLAALETMRSCQINVINA